MWIYPIMLTGFCSEVNIFGFEYGRQFLYQKQNPRIIHIICHSVLPPLSVSRNKISRILTEIGPRPRLQCVVSDERRWPGGSRLTAEPVLAYVGLGGLLYGCKR